MSLKYSSGKVGKISYNGKNLTVWKYDYVEDYLAEVKNLGRPLDKDSIAWVEGDFLVYITEIVADTDKGGNITWVTPRFYEALDFLKAKPETSRGRRREIKVIEDDCGAEDLWKGILDFDWDSIMIKTTVIE